MEKETLIKTLRNVRSSKEDLRRALASALGVEYESKTEEKSVSLFTLCQREFMRQYSDFTSLDYTFASRDGKALKDIVEALGKMQGVSSDNDVYYLFCTLITNLPEWYKNNAFTLSAICKNLNTIISKIKHGRKQESDDAELAARILRKLQS